MDIVVKFLLDNIPDPRVFPGFILGLGWLIWLILKVCQWPRPRLSTMLIYSVSVAIAFTLQLPKMSICAIFVDRCSPNSPPWYRFLSDLVVWFAVLYVVMKLALKRGQQRFEQPKNGAVSQ